MEATEMMDRIIPYATDYLTNYSQFALKEWGGNAYQASPNYIDWLYQANPLRTMSTDFLIVISKENVVVGCIHKLRMSWLFGQQQIEMPTIHNLVVAESHRARFGLPLILRALRADEYGIVPGTAPPQSEIFEKLKCQSIPVTWHRKVLKPFTGSARILLQKLGKKFSPNFLSPMLQLNLSNNVHITTQPSETLLAQVAKVLMQRAQQHHLVPFWDAKQLAWRFFHAKGPTHALIYQTTAHAELDFIIVSLGPRHQLTVARIVELAISQTNHFSILVRTAERFAKQYGAHVFLAYIPQSNIDHLFAEQGWRKINPVPAKTFFYQRSKGICFDSYCMSAGTIDYGFEATRPL
jgi:hypothetical protein